MRDGRNQIAEIERNLSFRFDFDTLMAAGMAFRDDHRHAGQHLRIAVQKFPSLHMRDRREVLPPVAHARPFVRARRVLEFAALHKVFGPWKRRHHLIVLADGIAAGVIEMQMRVDDHMNVFGPKTPGLQGVAKRRDAFHRKHVPKLCVRLIADTRIHQDVLAVCLEEQTVQAQLNPILLVRLATRLPKHLRDHPEHGAPVQPKPAVRH